MFWPLFQLCDQLHSTRECKKPNCSPPKCVNCGGAEPGNFTDCRSHTQQLSSLHRRLSRVTKPTTSAFQLKQLKQAHFIAFKPLASPPRLHTTRVQTASQLLTTTDPQSLSSLLDTVKSFLSLFNIKNLCHTLRPLVLRLQTTSDRLSKIMLGLDDDVACFSSSINHDLRMVVYSDNSVTP
jgi:hypothetical protein